MNIKSFELELKGEPGTGKTLFLQRLQKLMMLKKGESLRLVSMVKTGENKVRIQHIVS